MGLENLMLKCHYHQWGHYIIQWCHTWCNRRRKCMWQSGIYICHIMVMVMTYTITSHSNPLSIIMLWIGSSALWDCNQWHYTAIFHHFLQGHYSFQILSSVAWELLSVFTFFNREMRNSYKVSHLWQGKNKIYFYRTFSGLSVNFISSYSCCLQWDIQDSSVNNNCMSDSTDR